MTQVDWEEDEGSPGQPVRWVLHAKRVRMDLAADRARLSRVRLRLRRPLELELRMAHATVALGRPRLVGDQGFELRHGGLWLKGESIALDLHKTFTARGIRGVLSLGGDVAVGVGQDGPKPRRSPARAPASGRPRGAEAPARR